MPWRVIDRLKEPSSWASLAAGFGTLGVTVPAQWMQVVSLAGAAVCVALGVILKEGQPQ